MLAGSSGQSNLAAAWYRHGEIAKGRRSNEMKKLTAKRLDFEEQALPYLENLYRTALYVATDVVDARDVVLKSFAKAYRFWYKRECNPDCQQWLFKIMVNALRNNKMPLFDQEAIRTNGEEIEGFLIHARSVHLESTDDLDRVDYSTLSKIAVKETIKKLPADIRLIIVLSLLNSFSYRQISEIADISLNSVRARMQLGRKLMEMSLVENAVYAGAGEVSAAKVRSRRAN